MNQQWYCRVGGKEYGPVSPATLQEWVQAGRVTRTDMVRSRDSDWVPLGSVHGITWPATAPVPPPVVQPTKPDAGIQETSKHTARAKLSRTPTSWLDFFDWRFEYYLTPWIIRALWIGYLGFTLLAIIVYTYLFVFDFSSVGAFSSSEGPHFGVPEKPMLSVPSWFTKGIAKLILYLVGLIGIITWLLVVRVSLEMMIVLFRIAEDIGVIKRKQTEQS